MKTKLLLVLRSAFLDDVGLKFGSLIVAIALFWVVHGSEASQKTVYVDVISTLPDARHGRMLVSEIPVRVRVTLTRSAAGSTPFNGIQHPSGSDRVSQKGIYLKSARRRAVHAA